MDRVMRVGSDRYAQTARPGLRAWERILAWILGSLLALALRMVRWTWRFSVVGQPPEGPALYLFWHGDQIALGGLGAALPRPVPAVLISRSRDGELACTAARLLGLEVVRGSSSRGAVSGALGLVKRLRGGSSAALAVDGPRGPRHRISPAASRLAGLAGCPVVPVAAAASVGLRLRSWDRLVIPAPFARVAVIFGEASSAPCTHEILAARLQAASRRAQLSVARVRA